MSNCSFIDVLARITELLNGSNNDFLELISPNGIKLVYFLILLDRELSESAHKTLSGFSVLLGLKSIILYLLLSVFFAFVSVRLFLDLRRKDRWGR